MYLKLTVESAATDWSKVRQIAEATRQALVTHSAKGRKDFPAHAPDGCLRGYCGIAATVLHHRLADQGIPSSFVFGHYSNDGDHAPNIWEKNKGRRFATPNHMWLRVDNKNVDITANQFRDSPTPPAPVMITNLNDKRYNAQVREAYPSAATINRFKPVQKPTAGRISRLLKSLK